MGHCVLQGCRTCDPRKKEFEVRYSDRGVYLTEGKNNDSKEVPQ